MPWCWPVCSPQEIMKIFKHSPGHWLKVRPTFIWITMFAVWSCSIYPWAFHNSWPSTCYNLLFFWQNGRKVLFSIKLSITLYHTVYILSHSITLYHTLSHCVHSTMNVLVPARIRPFQHLMIWSQQNYCRLQNTMFCLIHHVSILSSAS